MEYLFAKFPKNEWEMSVNAMESKILEVAHLITHRVNLVDLNIALKMTLNKTDFYCKVMVINNPSLA
jgi:threonine dehydrogenase-like Zn-dependent dehydrogenase